MTTNEHRNFAQEDYGISYNSRKRSIRIYSSIIYLINRPRHFFFGLKNNTYLFKLFFSENFVYKLNDFIYKIIKKLNIFCIIYFKVNIELNKLKKIYILNLNKSIETYAQRVKECTDDLLTISRLRLTSITTHIFP